MNFIKFNLLQKIYYFYLLLKYKNLYNNKIITIFIEIKLLDF